MRLSLRSIIGMSAAFATMAFVLGAAILAPAEPSPATVSVCPPKMKSDMRAPQPSRA